MGKWFKWLALAVLGVVALVGIAVGILLAVIDEGTIKQQLASVVKENTGGELTIDGGLGVSIFPQLGLSVERLQFTPPDEKSPLAAIGTLRLGVDFLPLLRGQINVGDITLSGLSLNLIKHKDGTGNWEKIKKTGAAPAETPAEAPTGPEGDAEPMTLAISTLSIADTQVSYLDQGTGASYQLADFHLDSRDINLQGGSFPADLGFTVNSSAPRLQIVVNMDTTLSGDLAAEKFQLNDTRATIEARGEPTNDKPIAATVRTNAELDLRADTARLDGIALELADLKVAGALALTQLTNNPQAKGSLKSEPFNLRKLLELLPADAPQFSKDSALAHARFAADLLYTGTSAKLSNVDVELDGSRIKGSAGISNMAKQALFADFDIDRFNLDDYALATDGAAGAPAGGAKPKAGGAAADSAPLLPVDTIKGLNLKASLNIGQLIAGGAELTQVVLQTSASGGQLNVSRLGAKLYGGSTEFNAAIDVRPKQPDWKFKGQIKGVQIAPLLKATSEVDWLQGTFNFDGQLATRGNDMPAFKKNLTGPAQFAVTNGVVREMNLEKMVCQAIATINRKTLSKSWGNDTQLKNIQGNLAFGNGSMENKSFTAGLSNTDLKGSGGVNLMNNSVDYRLGIRIIGEMREVDPACEVNKRYRDVYWPLRCKGSLDGEPSKLCGIDESGLNDIAQKMAEEELRGRATEAAEDALKRLFKR